MRSATANYLDVDSVSAEESTSYLGMAGVPNTIMLQIDRASQHMCSSQTRLSQPAVLFYTGDRSYMQAKSRVMPVSGLVPTHLSHGPSGGGELENVMQL